MVQHDSRVIGLTSTVLAVSVPESLLSYGGKLLFAILTAILTSYVSQIVRNMMEKARKAGG